MPLQLFRLHVVDPGRALIAFHRFQRPRQVLVPDYLFQQMLVHRSLSEGPRSSAWFLRSRLTAAAPLLPTRTPQLATVIVALEIRILFLRRLQFLL
jgi:hypothetical protein